MDLFTLPEFTLGQISPEQQRPELSTLQEDGKPFRDNHLRTNEQLDFGCFHHHALLWQGKQTDPPAHAGSSPIAKHIQAHMSEMGFTRLHFALK